MGGGRHCEDSMLVFALPACHIADVSGNLEMLSLSDVSLGGYAHDHLLAAEQRVADKLARAQGHLAFRHDCGCRFDLSDSVSTVSARLAYFEVVDVRRVKFRCARANCQAMGFVFRLRQEFGRNFELPPGARCRRLDVREKTPSKGPMQHTAELVPKPQADNLAKLNCDTDRDGA